MNNKSNSSIEIATYIMSLKLKRLKELKNENNDLIKSNIQRRKKLLEFREKNIKSLEKFLENSKNNLKEFMESDKI